MMSRSDAAGLGKVVMRWSRSAGSRQEGMPFDGAKARAVDDFRRRTSSAGDSTVEVPIALLEDEFRFRHVLSTRALDSEIKGLRSLTISAVDRWNSDNNDEDSYIGRCSSYGPQRSINEVDLFPADAISDLHAIASRMTAAGYGSECVGAYASVRKPAVEAALSRIGLENDERSIEDVHWLEWDALEAMIRRWTRASRAAVRGVFASERRLCSLVFHDDVHLLNKHDSTTATAAADAAFAETVNGAARQFLGFAEAISGGRRSPEKLFKIIDMHDALVDLLPDISDIFNATALIYVQAVEARKSLADAVRGILSEFEGAVLRDPSKIPVPGGTVHPLTRYVMNYNNLICDYKGSLSELIISRPCRIINGTDELVTPPAFPADLPDPDSQLTVAAHLISIVVALEHNIESKASLYKDPALSHLFLMNNVRYIVHKARDSSELSGLIGDDYLKRLTCKFRQAATRYQRSGWFKILNYLRDEGLRVSSGFSSGISKLALRERFKGFGAGFGEAHKVQSGWYVPDIRLREELRISVSERLLLAYRPFLGRFRHHVEKGRRSKSCIKYSVEDLETAMEDFFEGASPSSQALFGKGILGTKYLGSSTKRLTNKS